jgi:hypothetical protein
VADKRYPDDFTHWRTDPVTGLRYIIKAPGKTPVNIIDFVEEDRMAKKRNTYYAETKWHFSDVQELIADVSDEEAEAWLCRNENHIRDRLTELGFEVIDTLLSLDPPKRETDND